MAKLIGDLFKVYTILNEYIYIEKLRDITREDFVITSCNNSVRFITDCPWNIEHKFDLIPKKYPNKSPWVKAQDEEVKTQNKIVGSITVKFKWHKELKEAMSVKKYAHTLLNETPFKSFVVSKVKKFDFRGCRFQKDRDAKVERFLKDHKEYLILKGDTILENKINEIIHNMDKHIKDKLNNTYVDVIEDILHHKKIVEEIKEHYPEDTKDKIAEVIAIRNKIEDLKKDIEALVMSIGWNHAKLLQEYIDDWEDVPEQVKETAKKYALEGKFVRGFPDIPKGDTKTYGHLL